MSAEPFEKIYWPFDLRVDQILILGPLEEDEKSVYSYSVQCMYLYEVPPCLRTYFTKKSALATYS